MKTKISEVENKIPDTSGLVTITVVNTKIGKIENKITDINGLVKKTDYDPKILDTEEKYFTTSDYNKFTKEITDVKIKEMKLIDQSDIFNLEKKNLN